MILYKLFLLISILSIIPANTDATSLYRKKYVSFVDKVVVSSNFSSSLKTEEINFVNAKIKESINDTRFEYVSFPQFIYSSFEKELQNKKQITRNELTQIISNTLSRNLINYLDNNKELIGKQYISEEDKNTFLALKAKAVGINSSDFEAVLNCGYFFVPYLTINKEKFLEYENILVGLEVLWYHVNLDKNNVPSVAYIGAVQGYKDQPDKFYFYDDPKYRKNDFEEIITNNCEEIMHKTKLLDEFKLTATITDLSGMGVNFQLGKRENIKINDMFTVFENVENIDGSTTKNELGVIKVRDVYDNSSYGQIIFGSGYGVGQDIIELPKLGINFMISGISIPYHFSPFNNTKTGFLGIGSRNNFSVDIKSSSISYGIQANVSFDVSNLIGAPELWTNVGFGVLGSTIDGKMIIRNNLIQSRYDTVGLSSLLNIYINGDISKKYYFHRLGFTANIGGDVYIIGIGERRGMTTSKIDTTFALNTINFGVYGQVGLEFYVTPSFLIGISTGYHKIIQHSNWAISVTKQDPENSDSDKQSVSLEKKNIDNGPELRIKGLSYNISINYALPTYKGGFWATLFDIF